MAQDVKEEVRRRDDTRPSATSSTSRPKRLKEPANYCGICELAFDSSLALQEHKEEEH